MGLPASCTRLAAQAWNNAALAQSEKATGSGALCGQPLGSGFSILTASWKDQPDTGATHGGEPLIHVSSRRAGACGRLTLDGQQPQQLASSQETWDLGQGRKVQSPLSCKRGTEGTGRRNPAQEIHASLPTRPLSSGTFSE